MTELRPYQEEALQAILQHKHKQAHSELAACAWLLRHGFEVFVNVSQYGLADLIAYRDGRSYRIDVKTDTPVKGYYRRVKPPAGIVYVLVSPEGTCRWWDGVNLMDSPPKGGTGGPGT